MNDKTYNELHNEIKKKYRNLLILKDFGYCEPKFVKNTPSSSFSSKSFDFNEINTFCQNENYFFGCGSISKIANYKQGETVVDLGCGCGYDCINAALSLGLNKAENAHKGRVIGIDMVVEMLERAREKTSDLHLQNIEFLEGIIEDIPLQNEIADIVISNCVINLSPNKQRVYEEIFRILKSGGRIVISDILLKKALPVEYVNSLNLYCSCVSGAIDIQNLELILKSLNFQNISIDLEKLEVDFLKNTELENYLYKAIIQAEKK